MPRESKISQLRRTINEVLEWDEKTVPPDVTVSTMTADAKLNVEFNITNICKYMATSVGGIARIKRGDESNFEFLNQVTVFVNTKHKKNGKPVSVKIFGNGRLHFTGVTNADCVIDVTKTICCELRKSICVADDSNVVTKKSYIRSGMKHLKVENLHSFTISMINCNTKAPFGINRKRLHSSLRKDGYKSAFDSNGHPAVKIRYVSTTKREQKHKKRSVDDMGKNGNRVTIFVFESGSIIIILGNQGFSLAREAYDFMYRYLLTNYDTIVKDNDMINEIIDNYETKS